MRRRQPRPEDPSRCARGPACSFRCCSSACSPPCPPPAGRSSRGRRAAPPASGSGATCCRSARDPGMCGGGARARTGRPTSAASRRGAHRAGAAAPWHYRFVTCCTAGRAGVVPAPELPDGDADAPQSAPHRRGRPGAAARPRRLRLRAAEPRRHELRPATGRERAPRLHELGGCPRGRGGGFSPPPAGSRSSACPPPARRASSPRPSGGCRPRPRACGRRCAA
jgi:hypothetical protein